MKIIMKVVVLLLITVVSQISFAISDNNTKLPKLNKLFELPTVDIAKELNKYSQILAKDQPLRFAIPTNIDNIYILNNNTNGGQWDQLKDGSWIWRVMVHAENAQSLSFGLFDFYLPPTAELYFSDWAGNIAKGPFTDKKNKPHKQLWTGPIIGDVVTIELKVSNKYKKYVSFSVKKSFRGFKSIWQDVDLITKKGQQKFWETSNDDITVKSGSCNIDVICDEANEWMDQVNSVARYTINGSLCTGQMVNNTSNNGKPLFLTANHCGFTEENAASINIWWNYQSNECRVAGSSDSGTIISTTGFNDTQSGSTFLASDSTSDFALLELDEVPDTSYKVFYTGWDRSDIDYDSAVGIHHPSGNAKRISFEDDPISITGYSTTVADDSSHLRIANWDLGTTEGGSSGSGLWNSDKLLIGQLHGGFAACGNNDADWYGRLYTSWEGGGTADSRLKDWLDPDNSTVLTLQGLGECESMNVSISHSNQSKIVGVSQDFSVAVSGGIEPYKYSWDINEDNKSDGQNTFISATYSQKFVGNITVRVTDNGGCTSSSSKAVIIEAPELTGSNVVPSPKPQPIQVCGNNDTFIDPGELWKAPIVIQNSGYASAENAYAVFNKSSSSNSFEAKEIDTFGNTIGSCDKQFIDISTTGTKLTFLASSANYPANDDGVAAVALTEPFDLYGNNIANLYLSSNGYFSTGSDENGDDYDNDCPIPSKPNNGSISNARIMPLHDDLITQNLYHQYFNTCPRQSALGIDLSCEIFMYKGVDLYNPNDSTVENFDFEAILYPTVNQWVYQYDGIGINPESSSIGLQNDNATDGAGFSCDNTSDLNTQQAICIFHKNNQLENYGDVSMINLETPTVALGNLNISEQYDGFVEFSIAENAPCGLPISIEMQAVVHEFGFNKVDLTVLSTSLGNNETCSKVTHCNPNNSNDIQATDGLWYNKNRSGNGNDMYFLDSGLVYLQYTALEDHSPIWYTTDIGKMQNNQAINELLKSSYNGPFLSSTQTLEKIGSSTTTLIDANHAIQTRTINGDFSADLIQPLIFSSSATTKQRTGIWYSPAEAGWGQSIGTQGNTEVVINYLYDNSGQPYWVLGSGNNAAIEDITMSYFNTFCPHCPKTPLQFSDAGTMRINYDISNTTATIEDLQINVSNSKHTSQWNRNNMPIQSITNKGNY